MKTSIINGSEVSRLSVAIHSEEQINPWINFQPLGWISFAPLVTAITSKWSNGVVEGHVNRLKMLKRQMYGRTGFELLRRRVMSPLA